LAVCLNSYNRREYFNWLFMNNKYTIHIVNALLLLCSIQLYWYIFQAPHEKLENTRVFSDHLSGWVAEDVSYGKEIMDVLSPDKIVYKTYERQGRVPVTLFVAFYSTMEKADLSHSPIVCFTGQGWNVLETKEVEIPIGLPKTKKITVNQLIQKKSGVTMITFYWYQSSDRDFDNRGIQKVDLFISRLLGKSDRNAFIRVNASLSEGGDIKRLQADLHQFVSDSYPELRRCFFEKQ
jgi:EpsI family protein